MIIAVATEGQELVADYRHIGLTLGRHPLALLRKRLHALRFMSAEVLYLYGVGRLARRCGSVTMRERPETAKGVIFLTLEDETGNINLMVWSNLLEQQRREVIGAPPRCIWAVAFANNVCHLVAKRFVDLPYLLGDLDIRSRNFQ